MKKIMIIAVSLLSTWNAVSAQNAPEAFDLKTCKVKLTEYLMGCHSFISAAITEKDQTSKYFLENRALDNYNFAMKQFTLLSDNSKLDEGLKLELKKVLEAYGMIVSDRSKVEQPQILLLMRLIEGKYKLKIMPALWTSE